MLITAYEIYSNVESNNADPITAYFGWSMYDNIYEKEAGEGCFFNIPFQRLIPKVIK